MEGGASAGPTSAGNSTAPCLSHRRDVGPHKQFQRRGEQTAQFRGWATALYTHAIRAHINTRVSERTHTHCDFGSCSLVLHSVFLWGNCWFQTGSIKDETTFALGSLWCWETYLQPALLAAARIDMHHAKCSVLAGETTVRLSHASSLRTKPTHSGLQPQRCVGYVRLIGSQNNSREEEGFTKFGIRATQIQSVDKHAFDWIYTLESIYNHLLSVFKAPGVMIKSTRTDMLPSVHHNEHNSI